MRTLALCCCLVSSWSLAQDAGISVAVEELPAPFAFADFSWVPGNYSAAEKPLTWGPFSTRNTVPSWCTW